jgi:hypothetical protein
MIVREETAAHSEVMSTLTHNEETDELIDTAKWLGCRILLRILQVQNECRLNRIFFQFRNISHRNLSAKNTVGEANMNINFMSNVIMGKVDEENTKLSKEIQERYLACYVACCKDNFYINLSNDAETSNIILSLTLYSDLKLKTAALDLFYNLHSQYNNTRMDIDKTILLDSQNTKMSYLESLNLSRALKRLAETTEKWYLESDSAEFEALENILSKIEEHLMIPQNKRPNVPIYTEVITEDDEIEDNKMVGPQEVSLLDQYFCKDIKYMVNPFYQNIFRHLEIYSSLQDIIKADHENLHTPEKSKDCLGPGHRTLVMKIYFILAYASIDNQDNKYLMKDLVSTFLIEHLEKDAYNYGIYAFLYEYFTDNYNVVRAEELEGLLLPLIKFINDKSAADNRKSALLASLSQLTRYHGIINQNNQTYIMQKLIPQIDRGRMPDFANSKSLESVTTFLHQSPKIQNYGSSEIIILDPTLNFLACYIMLVRRCGEGRNNQTEYVAQIMLPLRSIHSLLDVTHSNLFFTDIILSFFSKIHVESSKRLPIQMEEIVLKILRILGAKLKEYTMQVDAIQIVDMYRLVGSHMERNDVFMVNHYGKSVQCCYSTINKLKCMKNIKPNSEEEQLVNDLIEGIFRYYYLATKENYRDICLHFMVYLMQRTGKDIAQEAKKKYQDEFNDLKKSVISKGLKEIRSGAVKLTTKIIKHSHSMKKYYKHSTKSMTMTTFRHKTRLLENAKGQIPVEAVFVEFLRSCTEEFFASRAFKNLADKEFHDLVEAINSMETENRVKKRGRKNKMSDDIKAVSEFFQSMIQFLTFESENIADDKLILIILQIFINFLKGSERDIDDLEGPDIDEQSSDHWKSQKLFNYRQAILVDLNIVKLIGKLLSTKASIEVSTKAIKLGSLILDGGNKKAQTKFLQYFREDKENLLARELHDLIDYSYETVENYMQLKLDLKVQTILEEGEIKFNDTSFKGMNDAEVEKIKEKEKEAEESVTNLKISIKVVKGTLRFLQLLCEGHYLEMQNYLRDQSLQELAINKRDFVETTARLFGSFIKINNEMSLDLGIQIIDFLVELIQGPCEENQKKLVNCKVVEFCKDLLNDISMKNEFKIIWNVDSEKSSNLTILISKTTTLLGSLLEGNNQGNYRQIISENFNFEFLIQTLVTEMKEFIKRKAPGYEKDIRGFLNDYENIATKDYFDEDILHAFQNFFFIQMVCVDSRKLSLLKTNLSPEDQLAYQFYENNSGCIEMIFKGDIQLYYFPIHPACGHLFEEKKDEFINEYNRESPNEKMIQFMRASREFIDLMDYTINRKTSKVPITTTTFTRVRDLLLYFSILLNIFIFVFSHQHIEHGGASSKFSLKYNEEIMFIAGIVHLTLAICTFLAWLYVKGPIVQMDAWRAKLIDIKSAIYSNLDNGEDKEICKGILQKNVIDQTYGEKMKLLNSYMIAKAGKNGTEVLGQLDLIFFMIFHTVKDRDCKYFLYFILFSALAFFYDSPFMYTLFLFDVIYKFDTLKDVIKAVTYHFKELISTVVLAALITNVYSSFGYYYITDNFYSYSMPPNGENMCISMWHCFLSIFTWVRFAHAGSAHRRRHRRHPVHCPVQGTVPRPLLRPPLP